MKPRIAIIGTGFGGLAAAIALKARGHDDLTILEKGDDVGGVWRENTYPGAACDVPSPLYSYSFAPNPNWPHRFSRQPAILDYIRDVADRYDLRRHIRFGHEVTSATYDTAAGTWTIDVASGASFVVDILIPAVGQLSRPAFANIPGRETFGGVSFHSAQWRHDVDLTGRRVAVIGTGASAVQFVPEVQQQAAHLTVFQRTPPYLLPRPDRRFSARHAAVIESLTVAWLYSAPLARTIRAISRRHMRRQAQAKPGLFEQVWPDYPIGCKRALFSNDYLPALTQPHVELVTDAITAITPAGVVTDDGREHRADVLIWGTGFTATEFLAPIDIRRSDGHRLADDWRGGAHAHYGMAVPGFPNLQIMYGPNTNTGGGSVIYFLEAQAQHVADYVDHVARTGVPHAVRPEVEAAVDDEVQTRLAGSVWTQCSSWYRQADGRIPTNWPGLSREYRRRAAFDPADYEPVPLTVA